KDRVLRIGHRADVLGLIELGGDRRSGVELLAGVQIRRPLVDALERLDLRWREATPVVRARALDAARIEVAPARIVDLAVDESVDVIALRDDRLEDRPQLRRRDGVRARRVEEVALPSPDVPRAQIDDAVDRRAGDDAVVVVGVALRLHEGLAAARGAGVEVRLRGGVTVEGPDDGFRADRGLVDRAVA